ncbi:nucleotide sugar dehydrogenase, partial [Candidatus Calescamantes bacterium]|nr:nucleotide sugar dehydrogenase [Candidatus Calescamantes bacterium]
PFYLSWKAKAYDFNTRFIELAGEVNGSMPYFVVDLLGEVLNKYKKSINGSTILIMGVAYKEDIDDTRESPAIDIIRLIEKKGGNVKYHDPYVEKLNVGSKVYSNIPFTKVQLAKADIVLLITAHSNVDYKMLKDSKRPVLDTRNGMKKFKSKNIFTF